MSPTDNANILLIGLSATLITAFTLVAILIITYRHHRKGKMALENSEKEVAETVNWAFVAVGTTLPPLPPLPEPGEPDHFQKYRRKYTRIHGELEFIRDQIRKAEITPSEAIESLIESTNFHKDAIDTYNLDCLNCNYPPVTASKCGLNYLKAAKKYLTTLESFL